VTRRPPRLLPALALAGTVLLVGACGDDAEQTAPPPATVGFTAAEVPVVVPGSPGEPTTTIAPGETGTMANAGAWTQADVDFVTSMVPHHAQALRMAELATERASDERVKALAGRIVASQGPEMAAMQAWLASQGLPEADPDDHGHAGMQGMASSEQLLALTSASGEEFDRLFLQQMTVHHEGAIAMADAAVDASNPQVTDMLTDTVVGQGVEIGRMQELLADLG
jgi:uncharacterized protein (DUF305 family)